eukprot:scaffold101129_cov34-Phaeocystis_antarctica.AAC.1
MSTRTSRRGHGRASSARLSGHHAPFAPRRRMTEPAPLGRATGPCFTGLCATGGLAADSRSCCPLRCRRCGGPGCGLLEHGPGAAHCCPARWPGNASNLCADPRQSRCWMPPHVATCLNKLKGTPSHVRPTVLSAKPGERDPKRACRCHGPHSRAYRGQCLPSFMIIGSQKAATSKLRWYVSRHAEIRIPKEENFHKGPPPVAAWDTQTDPALLSRYLDNLDD